LQLAAVADGHPARATTEIFPRLGGAIEIKPAQLAGGGVALRTRLGSSGVNLLPLGDGMFPLYPAQRWKVKPSSSWQRFKHSAWKTQPGEKFTTKTDHSPNTC